MSPTPLQAIIRWRQSVRLFDERPISDAEVLSLIAAAHEAPSAENGQPWRFIAVRDAAAREELKQACLSGIYAHTRFAAKAPLIIVLCADRSGVAAKAMSVKDRAMYQLDCGIAGEHLVLRAAEMGIGTCWIGWFNRSAARRALGAPRHVQVVALIAAGYPRSNRVIRPRRRAPLSSMLWKDSWGALFPGAADQDRDEK
jgi:nitroreductase